MTKFKTYHEAYFDFLINRNRASYDEFIKLLKVARPELVTYNEIFCKVEADLIDAISDIFRKRKLQGKQNESLKQKPAHTS